VKKILICGVITVLTGILLSFLLVRKVEPIFSLSLKVSDFNYSLNRKNLSDEITLVLVDERSVNRFGRWPWNRKIFSEGLKRLKGAKVVILDMVFSEKTVKEDDEYLAKTIEELENVVCGFFIRKRAKAEGIVLEDERVEMIASKASYKTIQAVAIFLLVLGFALNILGNSLGNILLFVTCLILITYLVFYRYYASKLGGI